MNKTLQTRPVVAALVLALTLALGAAVGALAAGTGGPGSSPAGPLAGAWRMTTLETGTEGNLRPTPYSGQIVFDDSGLVSVQAMNPDSGAPDTPYTVNGYEAWSGNAVVDPAAGRFTATVDSAAVRDLIGQQLARNFEVNGDTLVLTPLDPAEGWRVSYQRV